MRKTILTACAALLMGTSLQAQTDVTSEYLVNPSFETLKASDGTTDVAVKTTLSSGLYGWTLVECSNYQVESEASKSSTGFPADGSGVITPADGTYYYFNRQGWGNKSGEIKTTTSNALAPAMYYFSVDYKAADYSNNNNAGKNGTTLGLKIYDSENTVISELPALRRSYSITNNGSNPGSDNYMVTAAWKKLGILFEVKEATAVTISIVQNLVNSGRSDVAYDNCRLYLLDDASATNPIDITGMIANYDFESRNEFGWTNGRINNGQQYTGAPNNYYMDAWNATFDMNQAFTLPGGVYKLTAATRAAADIEVSNIYANIDDGKHNSTDTHKVGNSDNDLGNGWGWTTVDNIVMFDKAKLTIGFYSECGSSKWAGADNFKLEYLGEVPASEYLPALNDVVAEVETEAAALTPHSANTATALSAEIAAAKALTGANTKEEIIAAQASVKAALAAAKASAEGYARVKAAYDYVDALDLVDEDIASYNTAYTEGTIADDNIDATITAIYAVLSTAVGAQENDDKTLAVINPSFEYNGGSTLGWIINARSSDSDVHEVGEAGSTYYMSNADGAYVYNTWWQGTPMSQTVKGLPAGNYKLSFVYASDKGGRIYAVINGNKMPFDAADAENGKEVGVSCVAPFKLAAGQDLTFTIVGAADGGDYTEGGHWWYKVDNFTLTKVNVDKTSLYAAIEAANAAALAYENSGLTTALTAAQTAYDNDDATQDEVNAATTALTEALAAAQAANTAKLNLAGVIKKVTALNAIIKNEDATAELATAATLQSNTAATVDAINAEATALLAYVPATKVAVANGNFDTTPNIVVEGEGNVDVQYTNSNDNTTPYVYNVTDWEWNGSIKSNAAFGGTAEYGSAGVGGNAAPAADMYGKSEGAALFQASGWSDQSRYKQTISLPVGRYIMYFEAYNANTSTGINSNYYGIGGMTAGDLEGTNNTFVYGSNKNFASKAWIAQTVEINVVKDVEDVTLGLGLVGGTGSSNSTAKLWIDNVELYRIEDAATYDYTMTAAGYGTIVLAQEGAVPAGLTAYTVTLPKEGATLTLTEVANNKIEANKPYVLEGEAGDYTFRGLAQKASETLVNGALTGTYEDITAPNGSYILQNQEGKVGFYLVDTSVAQPKVKANRAYLTVPAASARAFFSFGDELTGIDQIANSQLSNGQLYDLSGRRVNKAVKGIYIINGKKVMK